MFSKYLEMEQDARRAYGLIATGLGLIGLTRSFKRRGMLRPYQFGYAATWVTLGSGIMQWTQVRGLRSQASLLALALTEALTHAFGSFV